MDAQRWKRIEQVFQEAVEMEAPARLAYLDDACAGDAELRREVESLLDHDTADGAPLSSVVAEAVGMLDEVDADVIGNYRLLKPVGYGGMGAVYQAERTGDEYRQVVAIKLLKRGLEHGSTLERFLHERRILARLDHPNIARLLDGGATPEGIPYLVMEYVDGSQLLDYCQALDVEQRLRLFRTICAAVQYAHRNLVIHRDIKPANVLVAHDGSAKLLDFGIAKLLDSAAPAVQTVRMLTPDYASPEQVLGRAVTTATDIYSLGVLLYELLTGARPFPIRALSPSQITRVIVHDIPPPPSTVVSDRKLRRQLEGDIDNIVLMAMRKEPERRYSSADQLSADVQRHLDGRPVLARKDTVLYRARKFVSRSRWAIAAAAAVCIALTASIVAANAQARRAEHRFLQVRRLANTFLFDFHDRIQTLPGSFEAREMVASTALDYLRSLESEGPPDITIQSDLANAYEKVADVQGSPFSPNLGRIDEALASYRSAIAIKERLARQSRNSTEIASLSNCRRKMGYVFVYRGRLEEALAVFRAAIDDAGSDLPSRRARILALIATADLLASPFHVNLGRGDEALPLYREALELAHQSSPALMNMARRRYATMIRDTDPAQALELYRAALAANRPIDIRDRAFNLLEMAYPLEKLGRSDAAIRTLREAIQAHEENFRANPSRTLLRQDMIPSRLALGNLLLASGDFNGAESEFAAARDAAAEQLATSPVNLYSVRNMSDCHEAYARLAAARGSRADAEKYTQFSRDLWTKWEKEMGPNLYQQKRKNETARPGLPSNSGLHPPRDFAHNSPQNKRRNRPPFPLAEQTQF